MNCLSSSELLSITKANEYSTISNDQSGNRAYPKGATEVNARTIKPKVKDFDPKKRIRIDEALAHPCFAEVQSNAQQGIEQTHEVRLAVRRTTRATQPSW